MTMKQTMETLMGLRKQGVDIFLTDDGWSFLVRVTEELEKMDTTTESEESEEQVS